MATAHARYDNTQVGRDFSHHGGNHAGRDQYIFGAERLASKQLVDLVEVRGSNGTLPTVESLSPYSVKATPSDFGDIDRHGTTDPYVPRTHDDVDARARSALASGRLVVVIGPSKAGKTRTLFEAVRHELPTALMVVPDPSMAVAIADCPEYADGSQTVVVWLENLDQFARGSERLTPRVLARLTARPGRTVVVATLRSEKYDELSTGGELSSEVRTLLEQAKRIELAPTSEDPTEQAAAQSIYPAVDLSRYGLAEMLAGAPALLRLYRRGRDRRGVTEQIAAYCVIVQVVIDWARIGFADGIPQDRLLQLARRRADTQYPAYDITDAHLNAAIAEARRPQEGTGHTTAIEATMLTDQRIRSYEPFDYLLAADDTNNFREVPGEFWHEATTDADPHTLAYLVGISAYDRGLLDTAETIFRRAADAGHAGGMRNLGLQLIERGELDEAETWLRTAADTGHTDAMFSLGLLLEGRGELDEAVSWYRTVADTGHTVAMLSLGSLLRKRGELDEAVSWYRTVASTGDTGAMFSLGLLLQERGELDEAVSWYRTAADTGHTDAMFMLGSLLEERGDLDEAETWYRTAANPTGRHTGAMFSLGVLLKDRGDLDEAETWLRTAAAAGHTVAMVILGGLLMERDDFDEAMSWYRTGAAAGNTDAMFSLGVLLKDRGDLDEAETWLRRAAAVAGGSLAMFVLGDLLKERGDLDEAETWYRAAAADGEARAMFSLGFMLMARGDLTGEGLSWCRAAARRHRPPPYKRNP